MCNCHFGELQLWSKFVVKFHIWISFDSFTKDTFIYVGINIKTVLTGDGREFLRAPERKITILLIEGEASTSHTPFHYMETWTQH